jgi:hypothetical protein
VGVFVGDESLASLGGDLENEVFSGVNIDCCQVSVVPPRNAFSTAVAAGTLTRLGAISGEVGLGADEVIGSDQSEKFSSGGRSTEADGFACDVGGWTVGPIWHCLLPCF